MEALFSQQNTNIKAINNFMDNTFKTGKEFRNKHFYQARINLLNNYWNKFYDMHQQMIAKATSEIMQKEYFINDNFSTVETKFIEISSELAGLIELCDDQEIKQTPHVQSSFSNDFHLPKISIPRFGGNYLEWETFKDTFTSLIHTNESLSKIQKFHYLKANLHGKAENLIKNIAVTEANYKLAWDGLTRRYENLRVITYANLKALFNLPKMFKECATELRKLLDGTVDVLRALEALKRPVDKCDDIVVFMTVEKLDAITRKEWEISINNSPNLPSFKTLEEFLLTRLRTLETVETVKQYPNHKISFRSNNSCSTTSHFTTSKFRCFDCSYKHPLYVCPSFRKKSIHQRWDIIRRHNLCYNCLLQGHSTNNCPSTHKCHRCQGKHHTMLHKESTETERSPVKTNPIAENCGGPTSNTLGSYCSYSSSCKQVLLATAWVIASDSSGSQIKLRALLDQGSQATFISESTVQLLNLKRKRKNVTIAGIGAVDIGSSKGQVSLRISSTIDTDFTINVEAFVLNKLTTLLPEYHISYTYNNWPHVQGLRLADPHFCIPGKIDMILGAEVCSQIFLEGVLRGPEGTPLAQSTQLGWILSGCVFSSHKSNTNTQETNKGHPVCLHSATISEVNDQLRAFWELEEVEPIQSYTQEEAQCDQFIDRTCRRNDSGRYIVKLPLCKDSMMLGESKKVAVRRLLSIERKFHQDDTFKQRYNGFMQEYFSLGHMEQVTKNESKSPIGICYIPHHGILKESSSSTKLRVVFDASHKTESGVSLNDIMSTGPKLQQDLSEIILRWRTHAIAFTADIEKMYRQILVDYQDTDLQRIVWRFSESSNIEEYRLLTVTYGTKSAPYLALKILKRLAQDEHKNFPVGAQILERDFFVDDVLSGSHDLQTALEIQTQLISILQSGGFHLRKWISNSPDLLTHLPSEAREISIPFNLSRDNSFKALGVYWSPILDQINIKVQLLPAIDIPTKRSLLSDAAKLYDPLGWISPTIIVAKIMFQRLWLLGLNWDDPLPADMAKDWLRYREDLYILETFEIPRWIGLKENSRAFELHGFSDASTSAYAAVVYSRIINVNGEVRVHLITGKTKVAPIRQISVPRLELCGAVLLAKLLRKCKRALFAEHVSLHAWTDSSVVLSWLKGHPNRWKTFIANRVSEIQGILSFDQWHHIPTTLNPADCASRGIQPSELRHHTLWWYGPDFLQVDPLHLPTTPNYNTSGIDLEERVNQTSLHQTQVETWSLLDKYSSLSKLIRVTATCHRFVNNLKISRHNTLQVNRCNNLQVQRGDRQIGVLTTEELTKAINSLILFVQGEMFRSELMDLEANKPINSKSRLLPLNPFIDDKGHLRVGGRLEYSLLTYQEKHPIILPPTNNLSSLIIHNAHLSTLHGGPQLTLSHIRNKYWIINGRNLVRKHIQRCIVCIRNRPKLLSQIMASLPRQRVTLLRPFVHSGVDYAGPINIKTSKLRTSKITKGYICLFICLATRAVHIEFVSDLTTEAFVAAFRRFSARRGHCVELWSDRGTNFVGANAELTRKFHEICSKNSILTEILANDGTKWNFIPPGSPHFGGIWESGIKSVKHHLRRVISDRPLTYEEMCTLLTQIEACLNSRPICSLSECADDLKALTPAHLLIGTSMKLVPEENLLEVNIDRLTRWKQVQQILQHFWKRWSKDYLHTLQQRRKWKHPQTDVKVNDVVLVKDENLPPAKWLLGKVEAVHPGRDGRVRVVTVKTKGSLLTRPVVKICVLPITDPDAEYECKKDKPT